MNDSVGTYYLGYFRIAIIHFKTSKVAFCFIFFKIIGYYLLCAMMKCTS